MKHYYYVKYEAFRDKYYGKYYSISGDPGQENKYLIYVMTTRYRVSAFTYMPYLKEARNKLGGEVRNNEWRKDGRVITCYDQGYKVDGEPVEDLKIEPNEDGTDKEDRVEKLINWLKTTES